VPLDNAWEYDPAADEWKALAPLPTKRGAASAAVANGKIYVTGGANSLPGVNEPGIHPQRPHNVLATVEEYDPATNSWQSRRQLLLARNHHVSAGVGDKVYVIGGRIGAAFISGGSNNVDLVEMYDPSKDLWTVRDKMPTRRSAMGAGVYNNRIIVVGGEFQDRFQFSTYRATEAYDPALNQWQVLPSMRYARHGLGVSVVGNRLYAVSGDAQSAGSGAETHLPFTEALQLDLVIK
jgi:N-acetylneuraminic acid mutarotase